MKIVTIWLKKNEIYFTTVCTLLLSIMAITVSIITIKVAKRQVKMDYFEKQPDFHISKEQLLNKESGYYEDTELIVTKLSGKAKNIEVENINWLEIEYTNTNKTKLSRFLIEGYYNTTFHSGKTEGIIQSKIGYQNNLKEIELENYIERMVKGQNQYVSMELKSYVQVKYLNFENEAKTEYFDASSISVKLINNDTLSKYFDSESKVFNPENTISLNKIEDKSKLFKIISKIK